ncbi:MAG: alkane 1-monooxygenase [Sphingomonadales bacterium]
MMQTLKYFLAYMGPATFLLGLWLGGGWTFLTAIYSYVLMPLMDPLIGADTGHLESPEGAPRISPIGRLVLWSWLPMKAALLVFTLTVFGSGSLSWVELIGVTLSFGLVSGSMSIVFAHELMHSPNRFERAMAEALMASCTYTHFCIEHVAGHHRRVATLEDPATARLGESLYKFIPRSIGGGLKSAWAIESGRLGKMGSGLWAPSNRMLRYGLEALLLYMAAFWLAGLAGLIFMAIQSYLAVSLLETVNYLEHYGLRRQRQSNGRYERVLPEHSWDTASRVTNWHLLNLGRHADHHALASRPFEALQLHGSAPQLPVGYTAMLLIAMIPPLWFRIMDPRVAAWEKRRGMTEPA